MAMINARSFTPFITFLLLILLPVVSAAAVPEWQIDPSASSITFTATQNNAPVTGKFTKFTGTIAADPNQLAASSVRIVVDMNSVSASYGDLTSTLVSADWFNVKMFPQAIFQANQFTKTGDNTYEADGTLTIRDKTVPIKLTFSAQQISKTQTRVSGSTTIQRNMFGVGQNEWKSTDQVKDDVKVDFVVTANLKG